MKTENSASHCEYYHTEVTNPSNPGQPVAYLANCEDIIQSLGLTFDEGCEFKSIWRRARARQGFVKAETTPVRDAQKAVHYAGRVLALELRKAADTVEVMDMLSNAGPDWSLQYPWSIAPSWGRFAATDADGRGYWYEDRPTQDVAKGVWKATTTGGYAAKIVSRLPCSAWTESLVSRP